MSDDTDPLTDFCRSLSGATEDVKWGDKLSKKVRRSLGMEVE